MSYIHTLCCTATVREHEMHTAALSSQSIKASPTHQTQNPLCPEAHKGSHLDRVGDPTPPEPLSGNKYIHICICVYICIS